jgi:hypothetical protein
VETTHSRTDEFCKITTFEAMYHKDTCFICLKWFFIYDQKGAKYMSKLIKLAILLILVHALIGCYSNPGTIRLEVVPVGADYEGIPKKPAVIMEEIADVVINLFE